MTLYDPARPLVADFCCCAGGGAMGYWRAGLQPIGFDKDPQPHFPFPFIQADALEVLASLYMGYAYFVREGPDFVSLDDIALLHASWPCQLFTRYRNLKSVRESTDAKYENLIPKGRDLMEVTGLPYVIENVPGSPLNDPIQLCGTTFKIPVRRHRWFELGKWKVDDVPGCRHDLFTERTFPGSTNRPNGRTVCNVGEYRVPLPRQKQCMQVDWDVTLHELSEMVPPAMTQFLGEEFLKAFGQGSLHRMLLLSELSSAQRFFDGTFEA